MTDIEQKALALVNEVRSPFSARQIENLNDTTSWEAVEALRRAIEQHEAFRREVSEAVAEWHSGHGDDERVYANLTRFIIAKPDPLVEAMQEWWDADGYANIETFRAVIRKRGGKITWGEG